MEKKEIQIEILNPEDEVREHRSGAEHCELVWYGSYDPGDRIVIRAEKESFVTVQADLLLKPAVLYLAEGTFVFEIPFGRAKEAYPQGAFAGQGHQITAEYIEKPQGRRNLSENALDVRGETAVYPHCTASVETRGESVFAARNTIDGVFLTSGHGFWPHTSWGEGEDRDAEIVIWFGRRVLVEEVQIFLRSDFPHDNHWKRAVLCFSDGYRQELSMEKTGTCQSFYPDRARETEWVKLCGLRKDENDPSPFPALTQWRVYGKEQ